MQEELSKNFKLTNNINPKTKNPPLNKSTSKVKQPVETKYRYPQLKTVNAPTNEGNVTSDSLNKEVTAKENPMNAANQKISISDNKGESIFIRTWNSFEAGPFFIVPSHKLET